MTEDELERQCLHWFAEGGWETAHGPDLAPDGLSPERADYRQVLLLADLEAAVRRINPHLPESAVEQAVAAVRTPESPDVVFANRAFHRLLLDGVPVIYKRGDERVHDHAFLVDFGELAANRFRAINQFTIDGSKQLRRPDVVCFINGLPLAMLELKSPNAENATVWDAFNQIQTYKDEVPDLFVTNEASVISDGYTARVGSLTANPERFMPWRTLRHEDDKPLLHWQLETMVRGFFDRELFLDYVRHFVLFESDSDRLVKKIAGYHQFHAVREAVRATVIAAQAVDEPGVREKRATYGDEVEAGSKKAGVVWHTQGSGKSISMCCYAGKLLQQPEMNNPTLVVVTDRNDLDGQLFATFNAAQELLKQEPVQADDRGTLRRLLAERESGGIIFTTVQKFALLEDERGHPILNDRHNIVVISDEAHRSQYGLKATLKQDGQYKYGYARHMRDALPNASFIGFTGTPVASEDKDTRAVFGDYVSIYDIQDAVDDGATVPIYYESRLAKLDINRDEIEALSEQVDGVVEDENDPLKLVIVRDMWLTGFDAPVCHTMYVDKPMKGHNLMQAIARVNRVFKDKPGGLVVDYIGIANELKQALKTYTDAKGKGEPTHSAEEAFAILLEKLDIIRGMFAPGPHGEGFDYSGFETRPNELIPPTANYILSLEDGKKRFLDTVLAMNKAFSLCSTLDEARGLQKEVAFLSQVKTAITKFTSVDRKLTQDEKNSALKQILDNALVAQGVTDVFALCGLDKPNIGLLSNEFLEDVRQMPYKNLAVELLEKLLKDDIKARTRNNVVQEKKYGDRLQETLRKYNNRGIETAQVIEELIAMAKQFQEELERDEALGLNPDEVAFYDALANNESAVRELGDEILKKIAVEITEKLRRSTTVDWQVRESVRAKLRILVRRTLQRYKYPPDKASEAVDLVLKQAEVLSISWSH